jgi:fatty-acyl-CoA synthase
MNHPTLLLSTSLLDAALAAPEDRIFLAHWRDETCTENWTFGEFWRHAGACAGWLQRVGVAAGDTVALVLPHGGALMAAFAGALWLGAVPTILAYPTFKVDLHKYRRGLAGVAANLAASLVVIAEELPGEFLSELQVLPGVTVRVLPGLDELDAHAAPPPARPAPDSIAFIQHSGGTTGLQKAAPITHRQALRHIQRLAAGLGVQAQDRMYSWLPLYHDMGLITAFLLPLVAHMPVVTQPASEWVLRPLRMLELMAAERCTLAFLPNFAFQFLADRLARQPLAALDLSHVRAIVSASEPVRAANMDAFADAVTPFGLSSGALHTLYGMAENVIGITLSGVAAGTPPPRLWVARHSLARGARVEASSTRGAGAVELVSCGRCLPATTVTVVNETGASLPDGCVGELVIRSDTLFDGYHRQPALTAAVLRDGALWSGDLGFCLEGEVYVTGRRKDLVIVGGRNIFPEDVEAVVGEHPAVRAGRAMAFGIFNERAGTEELVVVAELAEDARGVDDGAIAQELRRDVAVALDVTVKHVFLHRTRWIVKSTAGKLARAETRAKLLQEHPELGERYDA